MKNKEIVLNFVDRALNQGDLGVIEEVIHSNYIYTSVSEKMNGREELSAFVLGIREAFPDLAVDVLSQLGDGDSVFTRVRITGTHLGEYLGMPPTRKSIDIEGAISSRIEEGLIAEEWELIDQLSLLQQLGVST